LIELEWIDCPYCGSASSEIWAQERGFNVVRCTPCSLLFVNPRIPLEAIDSAVRSGAHASEAGGLQVSSRRVFKKVDYYEKAIGQVFHDVWASRRPVSWLDVGAGYGELVEAVARLAPAGSSIEGLEPMRPKAEAAQMRGLRVTEGYLQRTHSKVEIASFVDVFSHIPDFRLFLDDVKAVLVPGGEVFMETGNLADLRSRSEFPGELGVPDHLVFAGVSHVTGYLEQAGFSIVSLTTERIDGLVNLAKTLVKRVLGRPERIRVPYTSKYRQLLIRARLTGGALAARAV